MSEKKDVSVIIKALDETVPGFKSARHHVGEFASETKKLLAEAFAGFTVFEFFKTAIEKSTEAEQSYAQLANTLGNVGVSYEKNRGEIEETIKALQKVANVRSDEAIKGFNTLVQRSGDYRASLKNIVLVADLAKSKHLEFNESAELIGRVMGGNTRVLKQFGIVTKDAHEGLKLLAERIGGAAAADMATFGGQVESAKIKFFNLAEAVGDVITNNAALGGGLAGVGSWFERVTKYVDENATSIGFWFTAIVASSRETVRSFVDVGKAAFHLGETIGAVAMAAKAWLTGDSDGYEQWKLIAKEASNEVGDSLHDIVLSHDRLTDAIAAAAQRKEELEKTSEARLAANRARNAAERAKKAQDEADKLQAVADKITDKQIATDAKVLLLKGASYGQERALALTALAAIEAKATAELKGLEKTTGHLERKLTLSAQLEAIQKAREAPGLAENAAADKEISQSGKILMLKGQEYDQARAGARQRLADMESAAKMELVFLAAQTQTQESAAKTIELQERLKRIQTEQKAPQTADRAEADKMTSDLLRVAGARDAFFAKDRAEAQQHLAVLLAADRAELRALQETNAELDRQAHLKARIREIQHALGQDEAHGFAEALNKALEQNGNRFRDASGAMRDFGTVLGETVQGPLLQFGESTAAAFGAMIVGSQTAGDAFRRAMLTAVASVAKVEGDFFVARALGGAAKGVGGNPLGFAEQAKYLLAAAAMYAVAGGASALATGGGGGSGSSPYGNLSTSNQNQGPITLVLNGKTSLFDLGDPKTLDEFQALLEKLGNNRQVIVLPMWGS